MKKTNVSQCKRPHKYSFVCVCMSVRARARACVRVCVCQRSPCSEAALCLCADRMKMMEHPLPPLFHHRDQQNSQSQHLFVSVPHIYAGINKIWIKIVSGQDEFPLGSADGCGWAIISTVVGGLQILKLELVLFIHGSGVFNVSKLTFSTRAHADGH